MFLRILVVLVATSVITANTLAGPHYTVRLREERHYNGPDVHQIVFSPDSSQVAIATSRGLYLVRTKDGELIGKNEFSAFSIAYSKDSSRLHAIGLRGRKLIDTDLVHDVPVKTNRVPGYLGITLERRNGKLIVQKIDPGSPIERPGNIKIGDELVGVGEGKAGRMVNVEGGSVQKAIKQLRGVAGMFVRLAVIARGDIDEKVYVFQRELREQTDGRIKYVPLTQSNTDENVAWCLSDGNHQLSSAWSGEVVATLRPENLRHKTGEHAISPDSKSFAWLGKYLTPPKNVQTTIKPKKEKSSGGGGLFRQSFQNRQDNIISGGPSNVVCGVEIFDIASRTIKTTFPIEGESVSSMVPVRAFYGIRFTPNSKYLVVGTWSMLHIYDIGTGKKVRVISPQSIGNSRPVEAFAVSEKHVAIGNVNGVVSLLDFKTGSVLDTIKNREDENVEYVSFSPDGKWFAYYINDMFHLVHISEKSETGNDQ